MYVHVVLKQVPKCGIGLGRMFGMGAIKVLFYFFFFDYKSKKPVSSIWSSYYVRTEPRTAESEPNSEQL
jgi:hypothetical protein